MLKIYALINGLRVKETWIENGRTLIIQFHHIFRKRSTEMEGRLHVSDERLSVKWTPGPHHTHEQRSHESHGRHHSNAPAQESTVETPLKIDEFSCLIKDPKFMRRWLRSPHVRVWSRCKLLSSMDASFFAPHRPQDARKLLPRAMYNELWDSAPMVEGFDPARFRLDILGSLVCRGAPRDSPLCAEVEHIVPFANNGRDDIGNLCLLNRPVNFYKNNVHLFMCAATPIRRELLNKLVCPKRFRKLALGRKGGPQKVLERYNVKIKLNNGVIHLDD